MSTISAVNNLIAGTSGYLSQTEQTTESTPPIQAAPNSTNTNADNHGPATTVNLSTQAQSAANAQNASTSSGSGTTISSGSGTSANSPVHTNEAPASGAAHGGGGGGGGGSSVDLSSLITEAKQQVAAQVGVVDANFLVDSKGNIDEVGLQKDLAAQQQSS